MANRLFHANSKKNRAFTLIELVVTIAIFGLLSGLIISNLRKGQQSRSLRTAADAIQEIFRQTQSRSLSGELFSTSPSLTSRDFGWQTTSNWSQYQVFKEQSGTASPYNKTIVETVKFSENVVIDSTSLKINSTSVSSLQIRFFPPYGEVRISGGSFNEVKNATAQFKIIYFGTTLSRTVTVDGISGNISVQ